MLQNIQSMLADERWHVLAVHACGSRSPRNCKGTACTEVFVTSAGTLARHQMACEGVLRPVFGLHVYLTMHAIMPPCPNAESWHGDSVCYRRVVRRRGQSEPRGTAHV